MRIGQTSAVVFLAKLGSSVFGFLATVYFARVLGPEVYGIYALVITVAAWLEIGGTLGTGTAVKKRISEGSQQGAYLAAGLVWVSILGITVLLILVISRPWVESYISDWEEYVAISVILFLAGLIFARILVHMVQAILEGQGDVHISGLLTPVRTGLRSALQLALVIAGFHLVGMIVGYVLGLFLAAAIGLLYVTTRPSVPNSEHLRSIYDFAKYSWLGELRSRTYQDVDILVLAALVPTSFVGIYAIVWSFIKILKLFGQAVGRAVFPEISERDVQEDGADPVTLIEDSLAYGGFIVIPGAVGGTILADRLLLIHGPDYLDGTEVFWLLLLGVVFWAYMGQCLNAMNGLNRPDIPFRVNLLFVSSNVALNIGLIIYMGWVGAAVASVIATGFGFALSFYLLRRLVRVRFPIEMVSKQLISALFMGIVVISGDILLGWSGILPHPIVALAVLLPAGVVVYIGMLFLISTDFRRTIDRNLPIEVPYAG